MSINHTIYRGRQNYRVGANLRVTLLVICALGAGSCKKYLDLKPNQALVIPSTVADAQAILDNPNQISSSPYVGELAADRTDRNPGLSPGGLPAR